MTYGDDRRGDRARRRPRCPRTSAACATGITATAGCATPCWRCRRCWTPGTPRRRWRSATSCCASGPATRQEIQIMYGIRGERRLTEFELPGAPRLRGLDARSGRQRRVRAVPARRVRRGDGRVTFLGVEGLGRDRAAGCWPRWRTVVEHVETIWREPDDGIWETRGPRQHFTYSKVMAWVVFDRAVRLAERFELEAPLDRWRADPRRDPRTRSASGDTTPSAARSPSTTGPRSSTRAC